MSVLLPKSRGGKLSLLLSGTILLSSMIELPLPLDTVNRLIALKAPEVQLRASGASMIWGRGIVRLVDVQLEHHGIDRMRVDRLDAALDLWPFSPAFGTPIRLRAYEGDADLDQSVIDSLLKFQRDDPRPFPMAVEIRDASLRWTDSLEQDFLLTDVNVDGHMEPAGARVEVIGRMSLPAVGNFEARLSAGTGLRHWRIGFASDGELVRGWQGFQYPGADWEGIQFEAEGVAAGDGMQVQSIDLLGKWDLLRPSLEEPRIAMDRMRGRFYGDVFDSITFEGSATESHGQVDFRGQGRLAADWSPSFELLGDTEGLRIDEELVDWLDELLPVAGEYVIGLEPRGLASSDFALEWSPQRGIDWRVHVKPAGLDTTFRGLADSSGHRFSLPYPAHIETGALVVSSSGLLFDADLRVGGAAGEGTAHAIGGLDFRDRFALAIDIFTEGVPIDRRISHALIGNPLIARLWRDLGNPSGGLVDTDIALRQSHGEFDMRVHGEAHGVGVQPVILPVRAEVDYAEFDWVPGHARFNGSMDVLGGGLWMDGEALMIDGRFAPDLRITLAGHGFSATPAEMRTLEAYLPLPEGFSAFTLDGDVDYRLQMILPLDGESPHISGNVFSDGATLSWPALGLDFSRLDARASFAGHQRQLQIGLGRAWARLTPGSLFGSLQLSSLDEEGRAIAAGSGIEVESRILKDLQALLGQEPWGEHIDWGGKVDLMIDMDLFHPELLTSHVDFKPLRLGLQTGDGPADFLLDGRMHITGEADSPGEDFPRFHSDVLHLRGPESEIGVHDLRAFFDEQGLQLQTKLRSPSGVALASRLPLLIGTQGVQALEEIGLSGQMRCSNLDVTATLGFEGQARVQAAGSLQVEDVGLERRSSGLSGGHALVDVLRADWFGPEDFDIRLGIREGTAKLVGLGIHDALAEVHLKPDQVTLRHVDAALLGGRLHTDGVEPDGTPLEGWFTLELTPQAPVAANCFVSGLELEQMRKELGLSGALGGRLDGHIEIRSPSPSPTFAKGSGWMHLKDGALGTVPVLKSIWRFAGISPPVFDEGDLRFRINGAGRIHVDEFSLQHELLRVTGKGSVDMDTSLRLKVTLRTLGFVGRLPLLKDVIDLLIEQQVYGPAEAPVVSHRAGGKLFGEDFERPPFPLWVPAGELPNWRVSPIFPQKDEL